jgi:hypothetical protein
VELSTGRRLAVDYVVLATGYKPDMKKVPYLSGVVDRLELADGFPVLDDHMYVGGRIARGRQRTCRTNLRKGLPSGMKLAKMEVGLGRSRRE